MAPFRKLRKPQDIVPVPEVQQNVLALFRDHGPMDDYELIDRYRFQYDNEVAESTPRTRRRELADQGLIKDTGLKNFNRDGRELRVWSLA